MRRGDHRGVMESDTVEIQRCGNHLQIAVANHIVRHAWHPQNLVRIATAQQRFGELPIVVREVTGCRGDVGPPAGGRVDGGVVIDDADPSAGR